MLTLFNPLTSVMLLPGIIGALVVDSECGKVIEQAGMIPLDLAVLATGNTELFLTKRRMMKTLGVNEPINDILITLDTQLHLLRPLHGKNAAGLFIYVAMQSTSANLENTRRAIDKVATVFAA